MGVLHCAKEILTVGPEFILPTKVTCAKEIQTFGPGDLWSGTALCDTLELSPVTLRELQISGINAHCWRLFNVWQMKHLKLAFNLLRHQKNSQRTVLKHKVIHYKTF